MTNRNTLFLSHDKNVTKVYYRLSISTGHLPSRDSRELFFAINSSTAETFKDSLNLRI